MAVSGTSNASAPAVSTLRANSSTASRSNRPTSAAVRMSWLFIVATPTPAPARKSTKLLATSEGYDAATATVRIPNTRAAFANAIEVDDVGRPVTAANCST